MKKIDKLDVFLLVCLCVGCLLTMTMWIVETILGVEVFWLRFPASITMYIAIVPAGAIYFSGVIVKIIEYFKDKKSKEKNR